MFFGGSILYITEECLVSEWHISSGPATPNLIVGRLKWIFIIPISKLFFFFVGGGVGGVGGGWGGSPEPLTFWEFQGLTSIGVKIA